MPTVKKKKPALPPRHVTTSINFETALIERIKSAVTANPRQYRSVSAFVNMKLAPLFGL